MARSVSARLPVTLPAPVVASLLLPWPAHAAGSSSAVGAPEIALTAIVCSAVGFLLWWVHEKRLAEQRRGLRDFYALSERILSARSPAEIVHLLTVTLPKIASDSTARLYLLHRRTNTLDLETESEETQSVSLPVGTGQGPAACFRNRTLLAIPDARRSPLYDTTLNSPPPVSVMLVPMMAEAEISGVLEIRHSERVRQFSLDQQAAAQHLANQIAIALKLMEQRSIREQLLRSEKLAAAGQLVSGVVHELQPPLDSLARHAAALVGRSWESPPQKELEAIAAEAKRASAIVSRLISFSQREKLQAAPVEINGLIGGLIRFRETEWKTSGIEINVRLSNLPLFILGSRSQLEQVLLTLLVHAEQCVAGEQEKQIVLTTRMLAQRVVVEIAYPCRDTRDPFLDTEPAGIEGIGMAVCRGIIQSHGGEIRFVRTPEARAAFEIELPAAPQTAANFETASPARRENRPQITVLVVEPEEVTQRHLTALLSSRGHRVVPVSDGEQAADLARRMGFDAIFSSIHIAGSNWVEFYERVHNQTGAFVLLAEGYDSDLANSLPADFGFVLHKPIDEAEFDRLLGAIESHPS